MSSAGERRPVNSIAPAALRLETRIAERDLVVATFGNILVCSYRGPVTVELIDRCEDVHEELRKRHPRGTATLALATPSVPIPDAEVRAHATSLVNRHTDSGLMLATAVVVRGEGFWASAARSALMAMFLISRKPFPQRCFADVASASSWLFAASGTPPSAIADFVRSILELESSRP